MDMIKTCCGFGHRTVFEDISEQLYNTLLQVAERGCETYLTGGMGDFDKLFSSAVRKIRTNYPKVKLICVKPYMTKDINETCDYLYTLYDDIIIPTELADIHYKSVITRRNYLMVDWSDMVVGYIKREYGGAFNAIKYAKKVQKCVVIIEKGSCQKLP